MHEFQKRYSQTGYQDPITGLWGSDPYVPPVGQLIVTGVGFGTKGFSEPITFERWDGTDGQLVSDYNDAFIPYNGDGAEIRDINPRFSGQKSAYNNPARNPTPGGHSQFWTNYKTDIERKGRTRYISYYVRVNYREGVELGGQIKFARATSSVASGGGGVYSGAGTHLLNAPTPTSWQLGWYSLTPDARSKYLESSWYPTNRWIHLEYEIYLNDLDTPNGFYNVYVDGVHSLKFDGVMQRETGYGDNLLLDTMLLGLEVANSEHWYAPNSLTASTDYTISATNLSATNYTATWNSGGSVPTAAEVVDGLIAALIADGMPEGEIRTNPENLGEFGLYWGFETVTVSANLSRSNPMSVQQGETYEDDDFKQFYVADAATWAAQTESHPQPYTFWSDTEARFSVYFGGITGQKWLYKKLLPNTTPMLVGEVVSDGSGGWEVVE